MQSTFSLLEQISFPLVHGQTHYLTLHEREMKEDKTGV